MKVAINPGKFKLLSSFSERKEMNIKLFKSLFSNFLNYNDEDQQGKDVYPNTLMTDPIKFNEPLIYKLGDPVMGIEECECEGDCTCNAEDSTPNITRSVSPCSSTNSLDEIEIQPSVETSELLNLYSNPEKCTKPPKPILKKPVRNSRQSWSGSINEKPQIEIVFPFEEDSDDYDMTVQFMKHDFSTHIEHATKDTFRNSDPTLNSTLTNKPMKKVRFNEQMIVYETFNTDDYPRIAYDEPSFTLEEYNKITAIVAEYKHNEMESHPCSVKNIST